MGKVILVTGGSRSGKSTYAEKYFQKKDDILYIATSIITDDEMRQRVQRHKDTRNKKWKTYEGYKDLHLPVNEFQGSGVLLDCITIMITNLLFEENRDFENFKSEDMEDIKRISEREIEKLVKSVREKNIDLVMVTNEVGCGLVPDYKLGRIYRDLAGFVNQYTATLCDEVYLVACGLPLKLK